MRTYINKASSDELQHPAKRGSKTLFAISLCYACVCWGRTKHVQEERKVRVDKRCRRGVKRTRGGKRSVRPVSAGVYDERAGSEDERSREIRVGKI